MEIRHGIFWGLNFGPGIFLGFWFLPHSIIPVTWNPEYPCLGMETAVKIYLPGVVNWTFRNQTQSNPIKPQSFDWLRLGSVIKINQTQPKILAVEHNRTFGNRTINKLNIIGRLKTQQSNIKAVSSSFKQGVK